MNLWKRTRAVSCSGHSGFFAVTRYLYPAVFPITFLTVEALRRMPARVADGLMLCLVAGSTIWYLTFVS